MESSFKKSYEQTVQPNGSIELRFPSRKLNDTATVAFLLAMLPASCTVTSPLLVVLGEKSKRAGSSEFPTEAMLAWLIAAVLLWILVVRKFNFRRGKVIIWPSEGLAFSGKQLPFKDIVSIGVEHGTSSAYVYAEAHGKAIKLTGYVAPALADALAQSINGARRNK